MGMDMIMLAERRKPTGEWEPAEALTPISEVFTRFPADDTRQIRVSVYSGRNYALIDPLLLGVAVGPNGSAGQTYLVEPVARIRGMPADATKETLAAHAQYADACEVSWVTTAELVAFDWDQEVLEKTTACMALAPGREARGWPRVGKRPDGDGWTEAGARYPTQFGAILQDFVRPTGRTYRESCRHFLDPTLPILLAFGPPDEVRVVFWYSP